MATEMYTAFRLSHGQLSAEAQTMKDAYVKAFRNGLSVEVCISMSLNSAEAAAQRDQEHVSDEVVVENMMLLLAAWAEFRGRKA